MVTKTICYERTMDSCSDLVSVCNLDSEKMKARKITYRDIRVFLDLARFSFEQVSASQQISRGYQTKNLHTNQ